MKESSKKMYVAICKYEPGYAQMLRSLFDRGEPLPADLAARQKKHALHEHELAQRGVVWAGGPSADFTTVLQIYSTDSLEEAKQALHEDEYYREGVWHSDEWFEWTIHVPVEKCAPEHRERVEKIIGIREQ